jgi:hypothetical protein
VPDLVVGRPVHIRAIVAEAGDGAVDDAWAQLADTLVTDAQALGHAGAEVLQEHVGGGDEAIEDVQGAGRLQVEGEAALAVVVANELGRVAAGGAERIAQLGRLDLDDVGAQVGQHLPGEWPGDVAGELNDSNAG